MSLFARVVPLTGGRYRARSAIQKGRRLAGPNTLSVCSHEPTEFDLRLGGVRRTFQVEKSQLGILSAGRGHP